MRCGETGGVWRWSHRGTGVGYDGGIGAVSGHIVGPYTPSPGTTPTARVTMQSGPS